jgi:hypothetical protein
MQMTQAVHDLVNAHIKDDQFPYMDFMGAFLLVERRVKQTQGRSLQRLSDAEAEELLGLPLGGGADDIKLSYVLRLLRSHGQQVFEALPHAAAPLVH